MSYKKSNPLEMDDMGPGLDFRTLVSSIRQVNDNLTAQAGRAVNISLTLRNWMIGAYIDEYELCGADLAARCNSATLIRSFGSFPQRRCSRRSPTASPWPLRTPASS
jgi:hypothetical protein